MMKMSYCFCRAFVPKCKPLKSLCCMYISVRIPYIREKCKVSSSLRHTYMSSLFVLARCVKLLSLTEVRIERKLEVYFQDIKKR